MRIGLLTEGGYPYVSGEARLWCDQLVRGLAQHEFDVYALSRSRRQEDQGRVELPPQVRRVRTAPLWTAEDDGVLYGRRARRRFAECYGELVRVLCAGTYPGGNGTAAERWTARPDAEADRFGTALHGLAELARDEGGLAAALRCETAVRTLERACRAPGVPPAVREARVPDLLTVVAQLERALRPLSLDWYEDDALGAVDLCHATAGGPAALPGLLARYFLGVPLLVTEYGVPLRAHYRAFADAPPAVRALLAAFHGRLAGETYRAAAFLTPGNAHVRRWQEHCGADPARLRTVYPGMPAARYAEPDSSPDAVEEDPDTLVWVGRMEPGKDLVTLLQALAGIREERPETRLRIVGSVAGREGSAYREHCQALAAQLFGAVADNAVTFEEAGGPQAPSLAEVYPSGAVTVLSSVVEGFPVSLTEAMFCGRATVSTDAGAVVEVIGGTGLVVPPGNPKALADACLELLRDPERRARLGAAARARALELFTVEQNVAAFHGIYLKIVAQSPDRRVALDRAGAPLPFAAPAEGRLPGRWTAPPGDRRPTGAESPAALSTSAAVSTSVPVTSVAGTPQQAASVPVTAAGPPKVTAGGGLPNGTAPLPGRRRTGRTPGWAMGEGTR